MKPKEVLARSRALAEYYRRALDREPFLRELDWYGNVERRLLEEAWPEGQSPDDASLFRACTALAVLSPETDWDRLLTGFISAHRVWCKRDWFSGKDAPDLSTLVVYVSNRKKAIKVFEDSFENSPDPQDSPYNWAGLIDPKTAPKTHAFARALMGDRDALVIDRHSAILALGRPLQRRSDYDLAVLIHRAALGFGLGDVDPRDLQARTWIAYRDLGFRPEEVT